MKQLTIFYSADLSESVRTVLIRAGIDGFLRVPNAVGCKPKAALEHGRTPEWRAEMIIAAAPSDLTQSVVDELKRYANRCDVEPCLRILLSDLDDVY